MAADQQRQFLHGTIENLPGLSFLLLSQASDDLRLAGWVGTVLAVFVCAAYARRIIQPHPILLGINLFMVAITPLIEGLYRVNKPGLADLLVRNIDTLVLGAILATGLLLTLFTRNGFLPYPMKDPKQVKIQSWTLLSVCAIGTYWSQVIGNERLISLVLPLSLLFGLQHYFRARETDKQSSDQSTVVAPIIASPIDPGT